MTKRLLLLAATASAALGVSSAFAADLPVRSEPPPPFVPAVPIFTWTGFYVGVNAGWGWRDDNRTPVILTPGVGTPGLAGQLDFSGDDGGFTGGGQIGYNYQIGSFVIGAEADIQWADTGNNQNVIFTPAPGFTGVFLPGEFSSNAPEWFGTLRARLGFAADRFLVYATGGLAYTEDNAGWVAGGGVEWALPTNWNMFGSSAVTLGLEGLWISIDRDNNFDGPIGTFTPVGLPPVAVFSPVRSNEDNDFFVARAKLNFKF